MRQEYEALRATGIQVLTISHQTGRPVDRWLEKNPLPFPWLYDPERSVIKAYGVFNSLSYDAFHMAHPTAVLVDKEGIVRFIYRCSTQWDVPSNTVLLEAVADLGRNQPRFR